MPDEKILTTALAVYCPVCGNPSVLVESLDRYMHVDGTSNRPCWLRLHRGGDSRRFCTVTGKFLSTEELEKLQ